jgi:MFS family permease
MIFLNSFLIGLGLIAGIFAGIVITYLVVEFVEWLNWRGRKVDVVYKLAIAGMLVFLLAGIINQLIITKAYWDIEKAKQQCDCIKLQDC